MSGNPPQTADIKGQYSAQVAADLQRNAQEQERIAAELATLEEQLSVLRRDHELLVTMQQALGQEPSAAPAGPKTGGTQTAAAPRAARRSSATGQRKKAAAAKPANTATRKAAPGKDAPSKAKGPTLVALVSEYLTQHPEPQSATEIATALAHNHPDRTIKTTVVRNTVENLVAKGEARRSKQGGSVYYTAAARPAAAGAEKTGPAGA
jgi:hypothetical protein